MNNNIIVGISSGHNPNNVNSSPDKKAVEWKVNLQVKEKIADRLTFNGFTYIDLNPRDKDYSPYDRAIRANENNCNAVYDVHCNMLNGDWGNWGGVETYSHPQAPENGGKRLAKLTHARLIEGTPLIDRGVKTNDYIILKYSKAPSALGEIGFLDNKNEASLLISEFYQNECANEITQGICDFFGKIYKYKDVINWKEKYNKIKIQYENLLVANTETNIELEKQKAINTKVKEYIEKEIKELDYVARKYFI